MPSQYQDNFSPLTTTQVQTEIATALTDYSTTAETETLITNGTADFQTQAEVEAIVAAETADFQTEAQVQALIDASVPIPPYTKTADESTTSTTLATDAALTSDTLPAGTYAVEGLLACHGGAFVKGALTSTGTLASASVVAWNTEQGGSVALGDPFAPRDSTGGTQTPISITAAITLASPGTIALQWASLAGSSATVRAGSYLRVWKIA